MVVVSNKYSKHPSTNSHDESVTQVSVQLKVTEICEVAEAEGISYDSGILTEDFGMRHILTKFIHGC
jgi:hypothetical protein